MNIKNPENLNIWLVADALRLAAIGFALSSIFLAGLLTGAKTHKVDIGG